MSELLNLVPAAIGGGIFTHAANLIAGFYKRRDDRTNRADDNNAAMAKHRDGLTFELLAAAREEIAQARAESAELPTLRLRLVHFEEALEIIQCLLEAESEQEEISAEKRARQFLTRMQRLKEAHGTIRNEMQAEASALLQAEKFLKGERP